MWVRHYCNGKIVVHTVVHSMPHDSFVNAEWRSADTDLPLKLVSSSGIINEMNKL